MDRSRPSSRPLVNRGVFKMTKSLETNEFGLKRDIENR